jgi:8-oxo-dGTP pyrophosphatase MutT (NUDIX family)
VVQPRRVRKVLAYVTRGDDLLVFHHRDVPLTEAGVQVPAGTVRAGEGLEAAAIREVVEETGREDLTLLRYLGTALYDVRPARDEIHERHFFSFAATPEAPDAWLWDELHDGLQPPTTFCFWWTPLTRAHVLAAGMGSLVSRI